MAVAAILLAAGALRIDRAPTATLPWREGSTLIEYQIEQLEGAGIDVIEVVLGFDAETLIPLVSRDNVEPIVNARWREGEAGSLRVGAAAVPRDTRTALIARLEEPRPSSVYEALFEAHHRVAQITRPSFAARAGSPIVAGYDALAAIRNTIRWSEPLDALIARWTDVVDVPLDSDVVLLTLRTREDYERALAGLSVTG